MVTVTCVNIFNAQNLSVSELEVVSYVLDSLVNNWTSYKTENKRQRNLNDFKM